MTFGEILKQKRLEYGWTKEYVSERTRLMVRVIDTLEAEDIKRIPSPLYGRGFIRLYCELLKIDPQPVLEDYNRRIGVKTSTMPVSRPAVHDLPAKPLEPIRTGGRKTMPPPKREEPEKPITKHKLVNPAEETFTSVPKPESFVTAPPVAPTPPPPPPAPMAPPPAPAPVQAEEPALQLEGDTLPFAPPPAPVEEATVPPMPVEPPRPKHPPIGAPGRSSLFDRPHKEVKSVREQQEMSPPRHAPGSIFGTHHPVPDPPNPQLGTLRAIGDKMIRLIKAVIYGVTRPKVERIPSQREEPLFNRQTILRSVIIFGVLILLTLLALAFRYVFQLSADAETETPLALPSEEVFSLRPVAEPPAPYFH